MKKFKFRSFIALIFGLAMIFVALTVSEKSEKATTPQQSITATSIDMPGYTVVPSDVFTVGDNESQVAKVTPAVLDKVDLVAANLFKKTDQRLTGEIMAYTGNIAAANVISCDLQKKKQNAITDETIMLVINDTGQNLNKAQMLTNTIGESTTVGFDGKMRTGQHQVLKHPTFVATSNV